MEQSKRSKYLKSKSNSNLKMRYKVSSWWDVDYTIRVGVLGGWMWWFFLSFKYCQWLFGW
jgi:hypothetical protein